MASSYRNAVSKKKPQLPTIYDYLGNPVGEMEQTGGNPYLDAFSTLGRDFYQQSGLPAWFQQYLQQRQAPQPQMQPQQPIPQMQPTPANIGGGAPMSQGPQRLPPPSPMSSTAQYYQTRGSLYGPAGNQPNVPIPANMQMGPTQIPNQTYDFDTMTVRQANDLLFGPQGYYTRRGRPTTGALANERAAAPTMANAPARLGGGGTSQPQAMRQAKNISGYMNNLSDVEAMMPQNRAAQKPTRSAAPKPQPKPSFIKNVQSFINSLLPKKRKK